MRQNAGSLRDISSNLSSAFGGLSEKVQGGNPLVERGQEFIGDTLNGKYLDSNPHTEQYLENTRDDITGTINSAFSRSSQANSARHSQILARELARAQNEIQFGQYNAERGNQMGALGMIPGMTDADYQGYSLLPGFAGAAAEIPYAGVNAQSRNQAGLLSPYSKTTQKQGFGSTLLNAAIAGAQTFGSGGGATFVGSDTRLKENIEKVGEFDDGLGIYEWDYIEDMPVEIATLCPGGRQCGVLAEEVAEIRPWALGPEISGFKTVNYGAL